MTAAVVTLPVPVPVPDPTTIGGWPAAAVAITVILAGVIVQIANLWITMLVRVETGKNASQSEVAELVKKFDQHIEADAEWKRGIEERLPSPTP